MSGILLGIMLLAQVDARAADHQAREQARIQKRTAECMEKFTKSPGTREAIASGALTKERLNEACGYYGYTYIDQLDCAYRYAVERGREFMKSPFGGLNLCAKVGFQPEGSCAAGLFADGWGAPRAIDTCEYRSGAEKECMDKFISLAAKPVPIGNIYEICHSFSDDFRNCLLRYLQGNPPFDQPVGDEKNQWNLPRVTQYCGSISRSRGKHCIANSDDAPLDAACIIRSIYEKGCGPTLSSYALTEGFARKVCALKTVDMQACAIRSGLALLSSQRKDAAAKKQSEVYQADPNHKATFSDMIADYSRLIESFSNIGKSRDEIETEKRRKSEEQRPGTVPLDPDDRILLKCLIETQKRLQDATDGKIKVDRKVCP